MGNTSDINYEGHIKELSGKLESMTQKYKSALEDVKQLTSVKIFGFLNDKKFPIQETEVGMMFSKEGVVYQIITNQLPLLTIRVSFRIPKEAADRFSVVAQQLSEDKHMIKAYVFEDRLLVDLQSYEIDCRHFYNSFFNYLRMLDVACGEIPMIIG